MTEINKLTATDTLAAGDLFPVYKQSQGDTRKASVTTVIDYINANAAISGQQVTQYAAPSANDFTITVNAGDVWLLITPTGSLSGGTITLPDGPSDRDTVTVTTTQQLTSLTVSSGKTVAGAPTALTGDRYFSMRYDAVTQAWYRVG